MRRIWFFGVFLLASSFAVYPQTGISGRSDGRITGMVIGQNGQPVARAFVMAVETLNQSLNNPPTAKSDSSGQFEISALPLRNYHVYASKEQDGYPVADPAYSEENQAAIELSPERPSGSVTISIRKAGIVTLDVRDKTTGNRVSGRYQLSLPQRWKRGGEVPVPYPLLIHPATDVMLEVSARGYKTWFYSDASNPSRPLPLRLESGEQKFLRIELEPEERNGTSTNP